MRKNLPKILTIIFLLIFILQIASLVFLFLLPSPSQAINFVPQVDIGANVKTINNNSIGEYIRAIYNYAIGIVGILATVVMMIGGIVWITAGGNQTRVGEAKAWIGASLSGLVLALASYTILAAVNPNLVNFQPLPLVSPTAQPVDLKYSEEDKALRDNFKTAGITVNKSDCTYAGQTDCTSLENLPQIAVNGIYNIKKGADTNIMITGGTEAGHKSHGQGKPMVDIRLCQNPCSLPTESNTQALVDLTNNANNSSKNIDVKLLNYLRGQVGLADGVAMEPSTAKVPIFYTEVNGKYRVMREQTSDGQHFHIEFLK